MAEPKEAVSIPTATVSKKLSGRRLLRAINAVAGLSIFFFGYDQGVMAGVNSAPDYVETMGLGYSSYGGSSEGWVVTITEPTRQGGIVSIYYLGTLLGCLAAGIIGDRLGRIKTIFFGVCWVLLGAALQASAQNVAWMLAARVIGGIGLGALNGIVPVWSAEAASHTSRGAFIANEFVLGVCGSMVAYWLAFGLSFIKEGLGQFRWRFAIAFQIIPMIGLLVFSINLQLSLPWMPESPRWLVKAGHHGAAREILGRLRSDGDPDDPRTVNEYQDIVGIVELERKHASDNTYIGMLFGSKHGKLNIPRRVQLAFWLMIVQEWVGIAAVQVYAPTVFAQAGYGARKTQWMSGVNDITYALSTFTCVFTIDRWGRRACLWWGAAGQALAMFLAGGFSALLKAHPARATQYGGASAFFIFLYNAIFGASWLCIPWIYPTETFPLQVRAKGAAWGVVGWSLGNAWLTLLSPVMFSAIGEKTLYVFGAVNVVSIPLVWAFYPETANRTLEEIDLLFACRSPFTWDRERNFARLKADRAAEMDGSAMETEILVNDDRKGDA